MIFICAIVLAPCIASAQTTVQATEQEEKAYMALEAIPEIQKMIKDDTGKVWNLMMRTVKRPQEKFNYYWIEVGQENGQRFVTQFHFYIKPPAMDVFYLDTMTDSLYTPALWRAKGK